jgi:hypothetical protein
VSAVRTTRIIIDCANVKIWIIDFENDVRTNRKIYRPSTDESSKSGTNTYT